MDNFNESLIDLVREAPVLWDTADKNHRNLEAGKLKWEEIAHELCSDAEICRKRWKTLRDRFTREEKGLKKPTGASGEDVKKWHLMALLSFLRPTVAPRRTVSNFHDSTTLLDLAGMADDEIMTEDIATGFVTEVTLNATEYISVDSQETPVAVDSPQATTTQASQVPHSSRSKSARISRRNEEEDPLEVALKKRLLSSSPQKEYTSDELFFLSIAKDCSALSLNARMAFKAKTILALQEAMQADGNEPNMSRMFSALQLLG